MAQMPTTTHQSLIEDEADSAAASQAIGDVVASVRTSQPLLRNDNSVRRRPATRAPTVRRCFDAGPTLGGGSAGWLLYPVLAVSRSPPWWGGTLTTACFATVGPPARRPELLNRPPPRQLHRGVPGRVQVDAAGVLLDLPQRKAAHRPHRRHRTRREMAIGAGTPPSVLVGQSKMTEFLYLGHLRLEAENARISGPAGAETAQRSHSSPRLRRPQPSGPWSGCHAPGC